MAATVADQGPDVPLGPQTVVVDGAPIDVTYRALVLSDAAADDDVWRAVSATAAELVVDLTALEGAALLGACTAAIAAGRRVIRVRAGDSRAARRVATTMAAILEARSP